MAVSVTSLGQDGVDLVGPSTSVGPDGVQDVHLKLGGLTGQAIASIVVQGPPGFLWDFGANPVGASNAEFFTSANGNAGDLYINPIVRSDLAANGSPLGSSTGAPITLADGSTLRLTVNYQSGATDSGSVTVANLASPPLRMPATPAPGNVVANDFAVTPIGQDGTSFPGFVHLRVTGLAGRVISSSTLSDQAGSYWSQLDATGQHTLYVAESPDLQTADLYFAPTRNEAVSIPGQSTATDMTLRLTFWRDPLGTGVQHVVQFAGGPWQPGLVANPLNENVATGVATGAALVADLAATGRREIDTIALAPGSTIVLTSPLRITHSVQIIGNGATVLFEQGRAPWPATATGAIYVANPGVTDISLDFEHFTIAFRLAAPLRWYASPGSSALFDPEADPYGARAVIDTSQGNDPRNREALTLAGMTILGPPAFDAAPPVPPDAYHVYAGEPAIPLVETGNDNGSITGGVFQGGSVQLQGGPWVVTGNTHLGSFANTYTPSAFALQSPHDVTISGNHVYQSDPGGRVFRLVNLARSGFNDVIAGNTFIGGQVGNEVTYVKTSATTGYYNGINDSEVILTEPGYFLFEGKPAAVSADGRVLVLPMASGAVASRAYLDATTGPGLVVSILSVNGGNGSPNPYVGTYDRVAQQISASPPTFLMQAPLPPGNYAISVVAGFVGDTYAGNLINLSGKSSTAMVLGGGDFGTSVRGNVIEGGTNYTYPYTGAAIAVQSGLVANAESAAGSPFPIPVAWSHYPDLGVTVAGNVIFNSLGNVVVDVAHAAGAGAETGRRYLTASVTGNLFAWQRPFLDSWMNTFAGIANGSGNPANLANDGAVPPALTIGSGFSANGGDRRPWTAGPGQPLGFVDPAELSVNVSGNSAFVVGDTTSTRLGGPSGQVYAGEVNGATYATYRYDATAAVPAGDPSPYAPFDARNLAIGQTAIDLNAAFTGSGVGRAVPSAVVNLDGHGNGYAASALGRTVVWHGATFRLGPAGAGDVVSATGQTLALPSARPTGVAILGASVYGPTAGTFTITYADGSTSRVTRTFSDWVNGFQGPGTTAPGESIAATSAHVDTAVGPFAQAAYLYGYVLPVTPGKTVRSITLPDNARIKILAIDLV